MIRRETLDKAAVAALPVIPGNPIVYLDVTDNDEPVGRIVIQLRKDVAPRAAENFRVLSTHQLGYGYRASLFYGGEKHGRVFTGDFYGSGTGGYSIYGDNFEDEDLESLKHIGPGTVAMRNNGPDSNNSQFYITLRRQPDFDGLCQVVGYVTEGFEVLAAMDKALQSSGRFHKAHEFRIRRCGELHGYVKPDPAAVQAAKDAAELPPELRSLVSAVAAAESGAAKQQMSPRTASADAASSSAVLR